MNRSELVRKSIRSIVLGAGLGLIAINFGTFFEKINAYESNKINEAFRKQDKDISNNFIYYLTSPERNLAEYIIKKYELKE